MCIIDGAARRAAVVQFLHDHPQAGRTGRAHPALEGCAAVAWSQITDCPAEIPALLHGLLDRAVGQEALRVLTSVLMESPFRTSAAMPVALPFLIRLAADPGVAVRCDLIEVLAVVAHLSQPVDESNSRAVRFLGSNQDHPERQQCRAALAQHASTLRTLLDDGALPHGLISDDDRAVLLDACAT